MIESGPLSRRRHVGSVLLLITLLPTPLFAQGPGNDAVCVEGRDALAAGWRHYEAESFDEARKSFNEAVAACPTHAGALAGAGYAELRSGSLEQALGHFQAALVGAPDMVDAQVGLGLTLNRLARPEEAAEAFQAALRVEPEHREARLGLGRALAQVGDHEAALELYGDLRAENPEDPRAVAALATVTGWGGDVERSEALWREAISMAPEDADNHVGLAIALRSQGQERAALTVLERALGMVPEHSGALTQIDAIRFARAPTASASGVYESDSDGNRVRTGIFTAGWRPYPQVELRWTGYVRESKVDREFYQVRRAIGSRFAVIGSLQGGWRVRGAFGGAESNVPGQDAMGAMDVSFESPREHNTGGWLVFSRAPFDVTSPLIERGVRVQDLTLGLRVNSILTGAAGLTLSKATYDGSLSNDRHGATGWFERDVLFGTVGLRTNLFSFDADLNDGYFDPDSYWLTEVTIGDELELGQWRMEVDLAPGLQRVGSGGSLSGTARGEARLGFAPSVGREVWLRGVYSTTGLSGLTTEAADYRYKAVSLGLSWTF
ncbi:MAG: tetratricopeptide repeat protein [Longimicrobiales bacterium]